MNPFYTTDRGVCRVLGKGMGSEERQCLNKAKIVEMNGNESVLKNPDVLPTQSQVSEFWLPKIFMFPPDVHF